MGHAYFSIRIRDNSSMVFTPPFSEDDRGVSSQRFPLLPVVFPLGTFLTLYRRGFDNYAHFGGLCAIIAPQTGLIRPDMSLNTRKLAKK
jgi:hypothetical protein